MAKTLMLGKIEGRRSRREDEVVAWLHQPSGNEFDKKFMPKLVSNS